MVGNKLELIRKDGTTKIIIDGKLIKHVVAYKLTQDMDKNFGRLCLELKIDIAKKNSTISIEDENAEVTQKQEVRKCQMNL